MSFTVQGSSHYVSDEQLLMWVATRQDNLYADLSDSMDLSEGRHEMASRMMAIKQGLQQAQQSGNFDEVDREMEQFLADYGDSFDCKEAVAAVNTIFEGVHHDWRAVFKANKHEGAPLELKFEMQVVKDWVGNLDDQIGNINQNDQLGMVHVQQLKSNIDQTAQAASALMAGSDKALDSIIGNVG